MPNDNQAKFYITAVEADIIIRRLERELAAAPKVIGAAILWDARCNIVREPRGSDVVSYYDCSFEETRDFKAVLAAYRATQTKEPRDG